MQHHLHDFGLGYISLLSANFGREFNDHVTSFEKNHPKTAYLLDSGHIDGQEQLFHVEKKACSLKYKMLPGTQIDMIGIC